MGWRQRRTGRPARRRPTDVVEDVAAWVLTSAGALLLVAAILSGSAAHADAVERGRLEHASRTTVEAVLVADAPAVTGRGSPPGRARADAAWVAPDGTSHTGRVSAPVGARAGSTVAAWIDRDGRLVTPPLDADGAAATGVVVAVGLLLLGGPVLGLCWAGVRALTGRANAARWEREWARVGPEWSRNPR